MNKVAHVVLFLTVLSLTMGVASAATLPLQGETCLVTSMGDSGPGTLRQALLDLQYGDTITFDPATFPPSSPVTISLSSPLPFISRSNITLDGSDAGVILDGSNVPGDWEAGLCNCIGKKYKSINVVPSRK